MQYDLIARNESLLATLDGESAVSFYAVSTLLRENAQALRELQANYDEIVTIAHNRLSQLRYAEDRIEQLESERAWLWDYIDEIEPNECWKIEMREALQEQDNTTGD